MAGQSLQNQDEPPSSLSLQSVTDTEEGTVLHRRYSKGEESCWVFLQASRAEFLPAVFLAGGEKNPPTQGYKQKAQQSSHLYFHREPGQIMLLRQAYLRPEIYLKCGIKSQKKYLFN